ncbi:uncharacterized protein [Palaemon carinicauda]
MRVVGLVSGGKDSCYNLLQCVAAEHEVVALANLSPCNTDELDSYMYQSVGHMGVGLYAEAVGVPLFRRTIQGSSLNTTSITYTPTEGDEVEDLFLLLKEIKEKCSVDAVSVGAVLSDYQRVRVENVCSRLSLVCLSFMWRRDQSELLHEMVECGIDAIIIKVAALGLEPKKHLGKSIQQMLPYLEKMKDKYRLNVCGEGGEYETFTLDCPIFRKRIIVKEVELVESSGDVGYLNFKKLELVDKEIPENVTQRELVMNAGVRKPEDFLGDLNLAEEEQQAEDQAKEHSIDDNPEVFSRPAELEAGSLPAPELLDVSNYTVVNTATGFTFADSFTGRGLEDVMMKLKECLVSNDMELNSIISIKMYIHDMCDYEQLNAQYIKYFTVNPPVRCVVEAPLPANVCIQVDVVGWKHNFVTSVEDTDLVQPVSRTTMHVQSLSHWAPANIGPYSQAIKVGDVIFVAGMIGLIPGTLQVVPGGIEVQARLALRHISRVIKAMAPSADIRAVVQGVCFVTKLSDVAVAQRMIARQSESQITTYVVVPALPRGALVEWQTWACTENDKFEYEEKGYTTGNVSVRIRRRWYHDNSICAVNAVAGCISSEDLTSDIIEEVISYTLTKADASLPIELTLYYCCSYLARTLVIQAVKRVIPSNLVSFSLVPVLALGDKYSYLEVTARRH